MLNVRLRQSGPGRCLQKCEGRAMVRRAAQRIVAADGSGERRLRRLGWLRGLRTLAWRAVAAFGHELIELRTVLGEPQPLQELLEFTLLVFEPAQGFGAVFIEGAIA